MNVAELTSKLETLLDDVQTMIDGVDDVDDDCIDPEEIDLLEAEVRDLRDFITDLGLHPDGRYSLGEMASFMLAIQSVK